MLGDRLAKRPSLLGVGERSVKARLRDTDRQRRDRDSSAGQRVQELPITSAARPQQVRRGDLAVLKAKRMRVGGMPPQLAIGLEHVIAGRPGRHHDRADLGTVLTIAPSHCGDRHPRRDVGAAVRDELLRSVDHPLAVARFSSRLGRARVRSRLRLGQPERPQLSPRHQVRKPSLLLLAGAELIDRRRAEADRRLQRDADTRVRSRDLLNRDAQREEICARAAHVLRKRQPEKAEIPHLADDVVTETMMPIELLRHRRDHLPRKVATRVTDRLLLRRQCKIHCHNPCM